MHLTRRAFLESATAGVLACGVGPVLPGCARSADANPRITRGGTVPARRRIIRPLTRQVVFIAGQGARQLGGLPDEGFGDGYLDHMPIAPGGFTLYCDVSEGT